MSNESTPARYVPALGFRWLTPAYDAIVRYTTREATFKSALLDQADLRGGQRVLDLACGTGTLTVAAKQRAPGADIVGLDGDPDVLQRAVAKARRADVRIRFDRGLSFALPYQSGAFDRVVCSLFFHHLQRADKQRTFAEIVRVLQPGAELHVADWGQAANPLMRAAFVSIQLLDGFSNTADNVRGALPGLMSDAGLEGVAQTRVFSTIWGTLSLYRAAKPAT
jgi:ubiquinone/menaquinone biosynthesis C-methylase UbiE